MMAECGSCRECCAVLGVEDKPDEYLCGWMKDESLPASWRPDSLGILFDQEVIEPFGSEPCFVSRETKSQASVMEDGPDALNFARKIAAQEGRLLVQISFEDSSAMDYSIFGKREQVATAEVSRRIWHKQLCTTEGSTSSPDEI